MHFCKVVVPAPPHTIYIPDSTQTIFERANWQTFNTVTTEMIVIGVKKGYELKYFRIRGFWMECSLTRIALLLGSDLTRTRLVSKEKEIRIQIDSDSVSMYCTESSSLFLPIVLGGGLV